MVSITLSVPAEVRRKMHQFSDVNWSGFIRKHIIKKAEELSWKEEMLRKFAQEQPIVDWAVNLQRRSRKGRFSVLKKKGLV